MIFDWTAPSRVERYVFERLNPDLSRVGAFRGVLDCSLEWSIYNTIRGHGTLDVRPSGDVNWPATLVRPWAYVSNPSGSALVPLMTAHCEVPDSDWTPAGLEVAVRLLDRTIELDQRYLTDTFVLAEGVNVGVAIGDVFTALGIGPVSITATGLGIPAGGKTWLPTDGSKPTSWLRVINDLCKLAGYFAVWTDPMGTFQITPYREPGSRVPSWRIADDGKSNRYSGLGISSAVSVPYNHWMCWSKATEETDPVLYEATNDDPDHPYSTVRLGRVVSAEPETDVEGDAAARARRAKAEAMADQRTFTLRARFLPVLEHEVVELGHRRSATETRASVSARRLDCQPGRTPLTLTLREIS